MKSDWFAAASYGLVIGAVSIIASVSMAALIFAGDLSSHLANGIRIALTTAVVTGMLMALVSSCRVTISIPQDRAAPILAIMAAAIASAAPPGAAADQTYYSIVSAIVATSLVTGTFLLALGLARAGALMRFIPYSVLGGFFAGTGWLLVIGGFRVMTGLELDSLTGIVELADAERTLRWLPGVALALVILIISRFIASGVALVLMLPAAAALFFMLMMQHGETLESLADSGWLLGPFVQRDYGTAESGLLPLIGQFDWSVVLAQWANIGTVVMISSVSIMLTVSALEMLSGKDLDINHELRVSGLANIAAGFGGGMVGFHSLSISSLAIKLGAKHRFTGGIAATTAACALYFGAEIIGYFPRILVGGLLLFIGFSFLAKWLVESWRKLPFGEYLVIPLILVTIAAVGFIEGLFVGLLAAFIQFVLKYSRTAVVRYALSGASAKSTVERNLEDERFLSQQGEKLLVLKLRGYLFFGTTAQLSDRIRKRLSDASKSALKYVLLDFQSVNGIDSSAAYEFHRLKLMSEQQGFIVILTGMTRELHKQLHAGSTVGTEENIREFVDLDHGLEWCEQQLLAERPVDAAQKPRTALQLLACAFSQNCDLHDLLPYLSELTFEKGDELIRQGDASRDLFFLEEGDLSVYLKTPGGDVIRLRRTGPGTIMGELGFYLDSPRSASVIADNAGRAFKLTASSLKQMERENPKLAASLHRFIADLLAERLLRTTHTLEGVLN